MSDLFFLFEIGWSILLGCEKKIVRIKIICTVELFKVCNCNEMYRVSWVGNNATTSRLDRVLLPWYTKETLNFDENRNLQNESRPEQSNVIVIVNWE